MSLRVLFCSLLVLGFSCYAYKNWFVSLCAAIALMAFMKHPDMPHAVAHIPGANLWNILIVNVLFAWWRQRPYENPVPVPRSIKIAVALYLAVIFVSFLRFFIDPTSFWHGDRQDIVEEFLVNSLRLLIPAVLLFDGCRNFERVRGALGVIVLLYFLLALQVIRAVGFHPDLSGADLSGRGSKIIQRSVGYDRVDMSMMLSGAGWAGIAFSNLIEGKWFRWGVRGAVMVTVLAQALTGGRMGYITWAAVGLILCTIRWRRVLPFIPVAAIVVVTLVPSITQRMFSGFGGEDDGIVQHQNDSQITSGRSMVWPLVIDKINENPIFGYGRQAMQTTGLTAYVSKKLDDSFPHPHEAYLEMLLDNGILGLLCIIPIYFIALKRGISLFLDRTEKQYEAAGGAALALVLALLIASFGAQTLYPREGVVGMWAAVGVAFRVFENRERKRWGDDGEMAEESDKTEEFEEASYLETPRVALGGA
jgi:O-antigen ligase